MLQQQGFSPYQGLDIPKKAPDLKLGEPPDVKEPELSPEWEEYNQETQEIKAGDRYSPAYGGLFDDRAGAEISPTVTASIAYNPTAEQRAVMNAAEGSELGGQTASVQGDVGGAIYVGDDADSVSRRGVAKNLFGKEGLVSGLYKSQGLYHIGIGHLVGGKRRKNAEGGGFHQTEEDLTDWFKTSSFKNKINKLRNSDHTETFKGYSDEDFKDIFLMKTKLTTEEAQQLFKHDLDTRIETLRGDSGRGVGKEFYDSLPQKEKEALVSALYRGDLGKKTAGHMREEEWGEAVKEGFRNYEMYSKLAPDSEIERSEWKELSASAKDELLVDAGAYEFSSSGVEIKAEAKGTPVQKRLVKMLGIAADRYNDELAPEGGRILVSNERDKVSQLRDKDGEPFKKVGNGSYVKALNTKPFMLKGIKRTWVMYKGEKVSIPVKHIATNLGEMVGTGLNMRSDKSTKSSIVKVLLREEGKQGPQLEIRGVEGGWVNVWWTKGKKTHKGWVRKNLINYNEHLASSILPAEEGVA